MQSEKLSIAISTYNRSIILGENLNLLLPEIKLYSIPIYISDDSTNDETDALIEQLRKEYEYIYYRKNETRLGHDKNFIATVTWPQTEYIWYLGDSMVFEGGALESVLNATDSNSDFIFINSNRKRAKYENGRVKDAIEFLIMTSWHLTLTGATIYSNRFTSWLKQQQVMLNKYRNFIQLGLIFDFCSHHSSTMYWMSDVVVEPNQAKTPYWLHNAIDVFVYDWVKAIESAAIFSQEQKKYIIKSHARNTGFLGFMNLFVIRASGAFSVSIFRKYKKEIQKALYLPSWIAFCVGLVPQRVATVLVTVVKSLRDMPRFPRKQNTTPQI